MRLRSRRFTLFYARSIASTLRFFVNGNNVWHFLLLFSKQIWITKYIGFLEDTIESDQGSKILAGSEKQTIRQVLGRLHYYRVDWIKPLGRVSLGLLQRGVLVMMIFIFSEDLFDNKWNDMCGEKNTGKKKLNWWYVWFLRFSFFVLTICFLLCFLRTRLIPRKKYQIHNNWMFTRSTQPKCAKLNGM